MSLRAGRIAVVHARLFRPISRPLFPLRAVPPETKGVVSGALEQPSDFGSRTTATNRTHCGEDAECTLLIQTVSPRVHGRILKYSGVGSEAHDYLFSFI